jgi:Ca-activated chloride channel family protein
MRPLSLVSLLALGLLAGCAGVQRPRGGGASPTLAVEAALGNRYVVAGARSEVVARLRIRAQTEGARRPPVNIALVVDTSGSMEGAAIADAQAACNAALDALGEGDRVAVVVFHSTAEVLVPSTVIHGGNVAALRQQIAAMRASGTTELAQGLRLGLAELLRSRASGTVDRLVLLSDGVPNRPEGVEDIAAQARAANVVVTALGLGPDYEPALMAAVAQRTRGRFVHLERSSEVAGIFRDEVLRVQRVAARSVQMTFAPGPGVEVRDVVGREVAASAGNASVTLADVAGGEPRDVFVRLSVPARRDGASVELLDVVLSYFDADAVGRQHVERTFVGAHATADDNQLTAGRNAEVLEGAGRVQLAAGMVEAVRDAQRGDVERAQVALDHAEARANLDVPPAGAAAPSEAIRQRRENVRRLRAVLSSMQHRPVAENRAAPTPTVPTPAARAPTAPMPTPSAAPLESPPPPRAFGPITSEAMRDMY